METPLEIHYWDIRGLNNPLITMCEYLGLNYTFIRYSERN